MFNMLQLSACGAAHLILGNRRFRVVVRMNAEDHSILDTLSGPNTQTERPGTLHLKQF